jgi:hypothetical protein
MATLAASFDAWADAFEAGFVNLTLTDPVEGGPMQVIVVYPTKSAAGLSSPRGCRSFRFLRTLPVDAFMDSEASLRRSTRHRSRRDPRAAECRDDRIFPPGVAANDRGWSVTAFLPILRRV